MLYAEQLNIDDCIGNNETLINKFKKTLKEKKKELYKLKNVYKNIDIEMNFIITSEIADTDNIIRSLERAYRSHLINFTDDEQTNKITSDTIEQSKIMEKEINNQKNKVYREVLSLLKDKKSAEKGKEELISRIQEENSNLIHENNRVKIEFETILKLVIE